jgi:hypothetical protein
MPFALEDFDSNYHDISKFMCMHTSAAHYGRAIHTFVSMLGEEEDAILTDAARNEDA